MRRLVLLNLVLWLAVAAAAGAAGFFFWDKAQYIRTNQAQVGADLVVVSAPGLGRITQWSVKAGDRVSAGAVLGTLQPLSTPMPAPGYGAGLGLGRTPGGTEQGGQGRTEGAGPTEWPVPGAGAAVPVMAAGEGSRDVHGLAAGRKGVTGEGDRFGLRPRTSSRTRAMARARSSSRSQARTGAVPGPARPVSPNAPPPSPAPVPSPPPPVNLTSPIDGTVLYTAAAAGTISAPGRTLAVLADLSKPFVIAYIDDSTLKNLSVGKDVDVFLDAYPGTSFPGKVVRMADAAGSFAAPELPSAAGTNQTRPTERVPVRIAVDDFSGKYVVPGMSASVRIHR